MIVRYNPFVDQFSNYKRQLEQQLSLNGSEGHEFLRMYLFRPDHVAQPGNYMPNRYDTNASGGQIAAIFTADTDGFPGHIYVTVKPVGQDLQELNFNNPLVDPLSYPLLFPYGTTGFNSGIKHNRGALRSNRVGNVSIREFYAHRLSFRANCANSIFKTSKLFQQYIVDAYVKMERSRLDYLQMNQEKLRAQSYRGLMDHLEIVSLDENRQIGSLCILPSSFVGGERYMRQCYQDAMAIVRKFGRPDLFVTFTANPNWPEIQRELNGLPYTSRPDICVRVFYAKFNELLNDLIIRQILGAVDAYVSVVEFQKRGLPHVHLLLFLKTEDKISDAATLDRVIWAEIPNFDRYRDLHRLVLNNMIHRCDERCWDNNGRCRRHFPKIPSNHTIIIENAITVYKRSPGSGVTNEQGHLVTNARVVPYNPYLLMKYGSHINVEWCSSSSNVKYLFKYVFKGHDLSKIIIRNRNGQEIVDYDEIRHFVDGRFVSSFEAFFRLYKYELIKMSHSIERLQVHAPEMHVIYMRNGVAVEEIEQAAGRITMLMAFFDLNRNDQVARQYLYTEIPLHYTFNNGKWNRRVRKIENRKLTRMYSVNPKNLEVFCIRALLMHVRGD